MRNILQMVKRNRALLTWQIFWIFVVSQSLQALFAPLWLMLVAMLGISVTFTRLLFKAEDEYNESRPKLTKEAKRLKAKDEFLNRYRSGYYK